MTQTKDIPKLLDAEISRFWSKVGKKDIEECWEWIGGLDKDGYGRFKVRSGIRTLKSHRLAYYLSNNKKQNSLLVCHKCDNPKCCNPNHLFIGTQKDNRIDCVKKGRMVQNCKHGEESDKSKLTADQVKDIIEEYYSGNASQIVLSKKYGVTATNIGAIVTNKIWKHLHDGLVRKKPLYIRSKITKEQAEKILYEYKSQGVNTKELMKEYDVSYGIIQKLITGVTWKFLHK